MKTLLILRHAKSSWKHPELTDHDRPLNKRGKRDAPRIGKLVRDNGLMPDLIMSSTAERARKTAKAVAKASGYKSKIELTPAFYHAGPEAYISALRNLSDDYRRIMVVGHNPGMEELLELLTGRVEVMPTAALALVSLPVTQWRELSHETIGELINLWRPRELVH
jgi:phosphohistidine phosphatase